MTTRRSRRVRLAVRTAGLIGIAIAAMPSCSPSRPSVPDLRVTSIQPTSGTTFGGTPVVLSGSGFSSGATVTIGGVAATNVVVVSQTSITAMTGARAAGTADVVVGAGGRSASLPGAFTFITPSTGPNLPPTIESLIARGSRTNQPVGMADLNELLTVTATVADPDAPVESFSYEWSATAGAFSGAGAATSWRAPASAAVTPFDVTLTLTVVERYIAPNEQGLPVTLEHRVTRTTTVRVHDSLKEVGDLAREFLTLFSQSNVPPAQVVANFSDQCPGKQAELDDTVKQRCLVTVDKFVVGTADVRINFDGTCSIGSITVPADACATVPVRWEVTVNANAAQCPGYDGTPPGTKQVTEGPDLVTAIYDVNRWRLCDSIWGGTTTPMWLRGKRVKKPF